MEVLALCSDLSPRHQRWHAKCEYLRLVFPQSLWMQVPPDPNSTLLQSVLKSDILIRSLAWVTTAHLSTLAANVRSNLLARWSHSQAGQLLPPTWADARSLIWQGQYVLQQQSMGIRCQVGQTLRKMSHQRPWRGKICCLSKNIKLLRNK